MKRVLVLAVLAACNQVYDLDGTSPEDDLDRDDDGVADLADNCPDEPNELQADADSDDIGDDCDICDTGSNHNEDGDERADGCDNCPHLVNDDQADADMDGIGDVCDIAGTQRRVRFDGFGTLGLDWTPGENSWVLDNDAVRPEIAANSGDRGLWNRHIETAGLAWLMETSISFTPVTGTVFGLLTRDRVGSEELQCYLASNPSGWSLFFSTPANNNNAAVPAPTSPVRLQLRYDGTSVYCELPGVASVPIANPVAVMRTHPGLFVHDQLVRFEYVDVIAPLP